MKWFVSLATLPVESQLSKLPRLVQLLKLNSMSRNGTIEESDDDPCFLCPITFQFPELSCHGLKAKTLLLLSSPSLQSQSQQHRVVTVVGFVQDNRLEMIPKPGKQSIDTF